MQFKFLFFIFATFLVMESNAYIRRELIPVNDAYPDKCFLEKYSMVLEFEKGYPLPRKCERATCQSVLHPDNQYELVIEGCTKITPTPPCKLSEVDLSKTFPNCCPKEIC